MKRAMAMMLMLAGLPGCALIKLDTALVDGSARAAPVKAASGWAFANGGWEGELAGGQPQGSGVFTTLSGQRVAVTFDKGRVMPGAKTRPCSGPFGDGILVSGNCPGGKAAGEIAMYSPDWLIGITGKVAANGDFQGRRAGLGQRVDGLFRGGLMHGSVRVYERGQLVYDGGAKKGQYDGPGLCRYDQQMETCQYTAGVRSDALHKLREEMRVAAEKAQLAESQAAAAEARREAAEQASAERAANKQAAVALLGAAAIGVGARNYSDAQRSELVDAYMKDVTSGGGSRSLDSASTRVQAQRANTYESELAAAQARAQAQVTRVAPGTEASAPAEAADTSWRQCGPQKTCLVGDGYVQFCKGPPVASLGMCKSECQMDSRVIYHDTTLAPGAYIPGNYRCPAGSCNVVNSCN